MNHVRSFRKWQCRWLANRASTTENTTTNDQISLRFIESDTIAHTYGLVYAKDSKQFTSLSRCFSVFEETIGIVDAFFPVKF